MTHTSTEQELYEKWRDDYALKYEPNYDDHLNADCKAAFIAGIQAARRAPVVPAKLDANIMKACFQFGVAAPQPPEAALVQLPEPDFKLDGGAEHCYYADTVRQLLANHASAKR